MRDTGDAAQLCNRPDGARDTGTNTKDRGRSIRPCSNLMTNEYVQLVGRMAYVRGYPLVNAHNRRAAFAEAPEPGLLGGVVPIAPVGYNEMLTDLLASCRNRIVRHTGSVIPVPS
jgi:hypothetical protein